MEGQWGTVLSFATWTLLPKLYHGTVASLILPCAMGNAIVAGGVYGLVDVACGGPCSQSEHLNKVLKTPWIMGSGIGASVGYVAPNYAYGPVMEYVYGMEGMSQSMQYIMNVPFATETCVATGAVAGMILHPLLYFPMNGVQGLRWTYFSGVALALVSSALYYVYYGREGVGLPVPAGSYISPSELELVESVLRYNNSSQAQEIQTYSLASERFIGSREKCAEGQAIAEECRTYSKSGRVVFDDRLLAFVYNYWDVNAKTRYPEHILSIESKADLQQQQVSMAITDASVAILLNDANDVNDATDTNKGDLKSILETIDEMNEKPSGIWKQSKTKINLLEEVCVAIELLMALKLHASEGKSTTKEASIDSNTNLVSDLERYINTKCPELTLYSADEKYRGASVESQLQSAGWKGPGVSLSLKKWENIVHQEETWRSWRNRAIFAASSLALSIGALMLSR